MGGEALAAEIKRAQAAGDPDTGETYYSHWLAALETIVADKGVTDRPRSQRYRDAWDHAPADLTPARQPDRVAAGRFRLTRVPDAVQRRL